MEPLFNSKENMFIFFTTASFPRKYGKHKNNPIYEMCSIIMETTHKYYGVLIFYSYFHENYCDITTKKKKKKLLMNKDMCHTSLC